MYALISESFDKGGKKMSGIMKDILLQAAWNF